MAVHRTTTPSTRTLITTVVVEFLGFLIVAYPLIHIYVFLQGMFLYSFFLFLFDVIICAKLLCGLTTELIHVEINILQVMLNPLREDFSVMMKA